MFYVFLANVFWNESSIFSLRFDKSIHPMMPLLTTMLYVFLGIRQEKWYDQEVNRAEHYKIGQTAFKAG